MFFYIVSVCLAIHLSCLRAEFVIGLWIDLREMWVDRPLSASSRDNKKGWRMVR